MSRQRSILIAALCVSLLVVVICWVAGRRTVDAQLSGTSGNADEPPPTELQLRIHDWVHVEDLPEPLAQFDTVFWEPRDTVSLRKLIREQGIARGKRVLEIGTGTGLIALCCLHHGATTVLATDINPSAVANAAYNADRLGVAAGLETRLVSTESPAAYAVLAAEERFDLIVSNPPWENAVPQAIDQYALYDESFRLLDSLLAGLEQRLTDDGEALLAYGCVSAIREVQRVAPKYDLEVEVLDDRELDDLPELFLPGMLLRVRPVRDAVD